MMFLFTNPFGLLITKGFVPFVLFGILLGGLYAQEDPITRLGLRATHGAAPGYVEDRACGTCHKEIYESYQHVGMAQSFKKPENARVIETFGKEFFHKPSQRYYKIFRKDGQLVFQRYNRDQNGQPINVFEEVIDWVMGSGNRARSYLYQTEWGELYTLPLGWYSEINDWGMSPGFETKDHSGVLRQVFRQCMFCHNAYPEVPEKSDHYWESHRFPKELPEGTGCQRCHGPGAGHIRALMAGDGIEAVRANIVNPAKLEPQERDSVCFQCHMLPTVSMIGSRRFDRADYSFRPGQDLSKYLVHVETEELETPKADRFEINHHGYRFYSSDCYQKSEGELACITCHNPHEKPDSKTFRAKVDGVCTNCHAQPETKHSFKLVEGTDCASCHMPTRRTRDVVLTTMTDHRIAKGPFDKEKLVAPLEKKTPTITGLTVLPFGTPPKGVESEIYRMVTSLRALTDPEVVAVLKSTLLKSKYPNAMPYMEVAKNHARLGDFVELEEMSNLLLRNDPRSFQALEWMGLAKIGQGKLTEAIKFLKQSIAINETPHAYYHLGLAFFSERKLGEAVKALEKAVELRPTLPMAHLYLGRAYSREKRNDKAAAAFRRSLEIEPNNEKAYRDLVILLRRMGQPKEAERYLELGLKVAAKPETLASLKK